LYFVGLPWYSEEVAMHPSKRSELDVVDVFVSLEQKLL
jgi:hypothetical protein